MPAIKKPSKFPGITELPGPIRGLAEFLYPQEPELPTPPLGTIVGTGPVKVGYKTAAEKFRPIIKSLKGIIATPQRIVEPLERFAGERLTDVFPATSTQIAIPEFAKTALKFPQGMSTVTKRLPANTEGYVQNRLFHTATDPKKVGASSRILKSYQAPVTRGLEGLKSVAPVPGVSTAKKPIIGGRGQSGSQWRSQRSGGKANPDMVREIKAKAAAGADLEDLAEAYTQLRAESIKDILRGYSWSWVK